MVGPGRLGGALDRRPRRVCHVLQQAVMRGEAELLVGEGHGFGAGAEEAGVED